LKNLSINTQSDEFTPSSPWLQIHPKLGISLMDHLFNKFDAMYPIRWRSALQSEASVQNWRETWADAFQKKGITPQQIAVGIDECVELYDWPPSLKEFIAACRTVKPAAHRNFPLALAHKSTPESRKEGLRKLHEAAAGLFAKSRMEA
jgi:hypothetical protein